MIEINVSNSDAASNWILRSLAVVGLLFSVICFLVTSYFLDRGLTGDATAPIASAAFGGVLVIVAVFAQRHVCRRKVNTLLGPFRRRFWLQLAALPLSLLAILGGVDFLRMTLILANQEYLHWFDSSGTHSFSNSSIESVMFGFVTTAAMLLTIGLFLFWFCVFHQRQPRSTVSQTTQFTGNPYSAPHP